MSIRKAVRKVLEELPPGVVLAAAAKSRTPAEILEAVEAGVEIIGQNYVQEAAAAFEAVGRRAKWHFIGHLQTNKVKRAVEIFDMIETVDSVSLAREIDKRAGAAGKRMPVLLEVNSGEEPQKAGVLPAEAEALFRAAAALPNIHVQGLMTMGPFEGDPEDSRPYFRVTKALFHRFGGLALPGVEMKWLSMGMSNSYRVAVEEGANLIRLGTLLFGPR
ncbi:MAG: YggS family pyridoxal phosphate-dependent enzyme [Candidatus Aminicenantes bacterium]|nr:YggS family pyridoxal phosphate-dependent enzyme [Candidatus Aminicenantes bacterium]